LLYITLRYQADIVKNQEARETSNGKIVLFSQQIRTIKDEIDNFPFFFNGQITYKGNDALDKMIRYCENLNSNVSNKMLQFITLISYLNELIKSINESEEIGKQDKLFFNKQIEYIFKSRLEGLIVEISPYDGDDEIQLQKRQSIQSLEKMKKIIEGYSI